MDLLQMVPGTYFEKLFLSGELIQRPLPYPLFSPRRLYCFPFLRKVEVEFSLTGTPQLPAAALI